MQKQNPVVLGTIGLLSVTAVAFSALAETRKWVAVEDLKRFTCPSLECGVVGRFHFRESVSVIETIDEWSRVTPSMSAGCFDGTSAFVESGPAECTEDNGIVEGEYSEWVMSRFLLDEPPSAPMQDSSNEPPED